MKISVYKTGVLNGSSYVKIPLRSSALLKLKNNDKYCFFGQFYLVFVVVKTIILKEFQLINKILMN